MTPDTLLPLPAATFHILMALADDDRHGYAIIQDVAARTNGGVVLSAGTLYRSIQRMLEQGLLDELSERPAPELDDERRRYLPDHGVRSRRGAGRDRAPRVAPPPRPRERLPAGEGLMRAYRLLLRLFPRPFVNEYGGEMEAIFARRLRDAAGPAAIGVLWIRTILETLKDAAVVQVELVAHDVRHAVRTLARARGFTVTAVLVTALGVGATTAVFSVADHVLLRPLPFPDPDRLVKVWQDQTRRGYSRMELSPGNFRDWKAASASSFSGLSAFTGVSMNMTGGAQPERLDGARVTTDLFRTLGVHAAVGRTLLSTDESGPPAVVIAASLWQRLYGADPSALGRTVLLDQSPYVIVGVMPATFHFPDRDTEFWAPLAFEPADYEDRSNTFLRAIGRVAPGVSRGEADARLDAVAAEISPARSRKPTPAPAPPSSACAAR